jgi:hypothetical protein
MRADQPQQVDEGGRFVKAFGKSGHGPGGSTCRTRWLWIRAGLLFS